MLTGLLSWAGLLINVWSRSHPDITELGVEAFLRHHECGVLLTFEITSEIFDAFTLISKLTILHIQPALLVFFPAEQITRNLCTQFLHCPRLAFLDTTLGILPSFRFDRFKELVLTDLYGKAWLTS